MFFDQNRVNNVFENELFFKIDFLMLLAPSCLHFGRGLGGVWGLLGASWAALWPHFFVFVFIMFSRRALGGSWARFWVDFERFGRCLGRVLEVKIGVFFGFVEVWRKIAILKENRENHQQTASNGSKQQQTAANSSKQ